MVKLKICGITNTEDARACVKAGCDALGFVFYKKSQRYIGQEKAREIIRALPGQVIKIGVFVNAKEKTIKRIARFCGLDILQFHGKESPEFCERFRGFKVIKAFRVKNTLDLNRILKYKTFAYLFDTFADSKMGGTGKKFNWHLLKCPGCIRRPVFLSGGLTAGNVKKAIELVRPDWVDVSSSVESFPGKKDYKKAMVFIKAAKSA